VSEPPTLEEPRTLHLENGSFEKWHYLNCPLQVKPARAANGIVYFCQRKWGLTKVGRTGGSVSSTPWDVRWFGKGAVLFPDLPPIHSIFRARSCLSTWHVLRELLVRQAFRGGDPARLYYRHPTRGLQEVKDV